MSHATFNVNVWDFGERPAAWRSPRLGGTANIEADFWIDTARLIERNGFNALFLADSPSLNEDPQLRPHRFLEPLTILARIAEETSRIGLIATVSSTFNDPVELAERALLIDEVTQGRFGANIVTTTSPIAARLFGLSEHPERKTRYERALEFVEAYRGYWQARSTGQPFVFGGRFFQYDIGAQPPAAVSEEPFLLQAGGSGEGRTLAALHANAVFAAEMQKQAAIDNRSAIRSLSESAGRTPPRYLPGLSVCVGSTKEEARRRFEYFEQLGPPGFLLRHLSRALGIDIDVDELDTKAKAIFDRFDITSHTAQGSLGFRRSVYSHAVTHDLTIRELLLDFGGYGHQIVFGTPEEVADLIEDWLRSGACDGFNLIPDVFPSGLERFADHVLPILTKRNLFVHPENIQL